MWKQILGTVLIATLGIVFISNILQSNADSSTNDSSSTEGGVIIPPDAAGLDVGDYAPDFELQTLEGDVLRLSDFRGKKVMVNFWATWCAPCLKEMPEMQTFYEAHQEEIEILAINVTGSERNEDVVKDFIEEHNYTFPVLLDEEMEVNDGYRLITIPTTYFIGTDGVIQQPRMSGPMTYDFMEEMLLKLN